MKVDSRELSDACSYVGKATSEKTNLSETAMVRIKADVDLTLYATNLEFTAGIRIANVLAEAEEYFDVAVPYKLLRSILSGREGVLDLKVDEHTNVLKITGKKEDGRKWSGTLRGIHGERFPSIHKVPVGDGIKLDTDVVGFWKKVSMCIDQKEIGRSAKGSVLLKQSGSKLSLVAANGLQLACFSKEINTNDNFEVMLSLNVGDWLRFFENGKLIIQDDWSHLVAPDRWVSFAQYDFSFPKFESLIAPYLAIDKRYTVIKDNFLAALSASKLYSEGMVNVKIEDDVLIISAFGDNGNFLETIVCSSNVPDSEPQIININNGHMYDMLSTAKTELLLLTPFQNGIVIREDNEEEGYWWGVLYG